MPSSFTNLLYHIVFSVKFRRPLLIPPFQEGVYKYVTGIIENKHSQLIEIGGVEDHVHILTTCSPRIALADFVRDIKANASKWLNEQPEFPQFSWQTGYGAFTVSCSQSDRVRRYVQNQKQRHQKESFDDEFRELLTLHQIVFDENRLFDDEHHG